MAIKTGFDLVNTLFEYVSAQGWTGTISGKVYKYRRPLNSAKEDVVINSLALDNEQIQTGVTNLNVYVPALEITTAAGREKMPNTQRMAVLATQAVSSLDHVFYGAYEFYVQQPALLIEEEGTGAYYFNIRVEWKNLNF